MTQDLATRNEPRELSTRLTLDLTETGHALAQASALAKMVETQFHEGHHFMHIPGTPMSQRPHLCDPGAGLIMTGYKVRTGAYRLLESVWDDENDHYSLAVEVSLVHIASGVVVSTGVGAATSHEVKYAYRWVKMEEVPAGLDRSLLPTRIRKDGARMYRVDNPDLGDLYNTLWKMAAKRGEGDATLKLPGCSELFAGYAVATPKRPQQAKKDEPKPRTPEEVQCAADELYGNDEALPAEAPAVTQPPAAAPAAKPAAPVQVAAPIEALNKRGWALAGKYGLTVDELKAWCNEPANNAFPNKAMTWANAGIIEKNAALDVFEQSYADSIPAEEQK